MGLPDYGQLSKWLLLFGENTALAVAAVVVYGAIRPLVDGKPYKLSQIAVGVLFGLGAIISTTHPVPFAPGVLIDMRNVFILVAGLSGGTIGAAIAAACTILFRISIGGPGVVIGVGGIVIAAVVGALVARRHGTRVREFGVAWLAALGLATGAIIHIWGQGLFLLKGVPLLPMEATIALLLLYPTATALLGTAVNMVHYSVWRNAQTDADAELKKRDEQLRASREHLALAQHVAQLASGEVNLLTGDVFATEETYEIFGLPPTNPLGHGRPAGEIYARMLAGIHPDDRATMADLFGRTRLGEDTEPRDFRYVRPDGEVRWLRRIAVIRRDVTGKAHKVISTIQDVTDRKRIEIELATREERGRLSEQHLASAQRVGKMGSVEVDVATGKTVWSQEFYHLMGFDPAAGQPSAKRFLAILHPDDRELLARLRTSELEHGETFATDYRVLGEGGSIRWIHRQAELVLDADAHPNRWIIVHQDITARKQGEAVLLEREVQLRQASERLALALEIASLGTIVMEFGTRALQWSDEVYKLLDLDPAIVEPSMATFRAHVHPDDQAAFDRAGQEVQDGKDVEASELRIVRADGQNRWIYRSIRVFKDETGAPLKSVATLQDITERKQAQIDRQELERQLTQAQKMEAVGNLTGGIAHDFNNLLSVILGRLEMAQEELVDRPEVREWIKTCINAANRGATLTRSMLAFSRQQPLAPVPIDLTDALSDVIALLPRTLGEIIEVSVRRAPDLWRCDADPSQLQNALLNLALNARDAMPDGGKLTIAAENTHLDKFYAARNPDVAAGDYVALSVSDSGTGMSPQVLAQAFEPFFTTKEVGKGSGLGLSMVYGFAKQSGGHVKIYSELGLGTTVTLYLPRSSGAVSGRERQTAASTLLPGSGTIIVVEDDEDMRALAITQLERLGYTVHSAATGPDALDTIEQHPQAVLLLTDLTLPGGLSGRELARRATTRLPHLRVVYMSGYSEDDARYQGRLDASTRLLQKPFGIRELTEALHAALH